MESAKRGRPAKADEDRRTYVLQVKLTPAERAQVEAAAKRSNAEMSTWARAVLLTQSAKNNRIE